MNNQTNYNEEFSSIDKYTIKEGTENKILVAMSGGVDSSAAALLVTRNGSEAIGVTMKLHDSETNKVNTCCSLEDTEDARNVCRKLGIPYYVFNFKAAFKDYVINPFIEAYENGRTPNPCIECNRKLKFDTLYKRAKALGFDKIATGHYAKIEYEDGRWSLKKAVDKNKDQSYVLYSLTQEELSRTLFPLGNLTKAEARELVADHDKKTSAKKESQDICFVPDGKYANFIKKTTKKEYKKGNFVDLDGNILGTHDGIINYTIGQRRGLNINSQSRMYVESIRVASNEVVVSKIENLSKTTFTVNKLNLIAFDSIPEEFRAAVKIRYAHQEQDASIYKLNDDEVKVVFDQPQFAITSGQAAVFYEGEKVLGGGTIDKIL